VAIQSLTDDQIRNMTLAQKDRWWLTNVFRGDMPQLTIRSALTGFILGGLLSATNLYVSAKTGITLGVGLTSVILAFAMFKMLSTARLAKDFTILENNAMQSIATSAGYMTVPLMSSFAAYFWKANVVLPWWQLLAFNIITSTMGVLVAFPMKRRFINNEQQPFPEGRACGVVLDTLYTTATDTGDSPVPKAASAKLGASGEPVLSKPKRSIGIIQAKALAIAGAITALIQFCAGEAYMKLLWVKLLGREGYFYLNERLDAWYYRLAAAKEWTTPHIAGVDIRQLALRPSLDLAMLATGGLMGLRTATSMLVGMIINFVILAPWMINRHEIVFKPGANYRAEIVNQWSIWWGVGIMVVGSLVALAAKPAVIINAFKGMLNRKKTGEDPLAHIELPNKVSFIGLPILAAATAWMANTWYGVPYWTTLVAFPLIFVLSLICTNSMALTSWTPTGALAKIPQFTFGMIDKAQATMAGSAMNPAVNLMTAGITASVAGNAANLLSDIKPGYMLGAKPRQQAIGHVIGIIAGAVVSTPLFYAMFLSKYKPGDNVQDAMVSDAFSMPSAIQWKGVADIIEHGFSGLSPSILWSLGIAAAVAIVFEMARMMTKGKFPLSPVSIGLGVVLPPDATLCMWIGALVFHLLHHRYKNHEGTAGHTIWVRALEPICAGMIAGAALTGIGDKLIDVFVLG
jgi:uncharacterized oligopeptide transporter (OPT) family protein